LPHGIAWHGLVSSPHRCRLLRSGIGTMQVRCQSFTYEVTLPYFVPVLSPGFLQPDGWTRACSNDRTLLQSKGLKSLLTRTGRYDTPHTQAPRGGIGAIHQVQRAYDESAISCNGGSWPCNVWTTEYRYSCLCIFDRTCSIDILAVICTAQSHVVRMFDTFSSTASTDLGRTPRDRSRVRKRCLEPSMCLHLPTLR